MWVRMLLKGSPVAQQACIVMANSAVSHVSQAHGKLLAALLMGVSQTVCLAQKGRNTQTRHIILLNAEGVEFVMENMV